MSNNKSTKITEPMPEGDNDNVENKKEFPTYEEAIKERKLVELQIKILQARHKAIIRECDILYVKVKKESKKGRKKVKKEPDPNRKKSGIDMEIIVPTKIFNFIITGVKNKKFSPEIMEAIENSNMTVDTLVPRCKLIKWVYDYVKHNKLYKDNGVDKVNKKFMVPDSELTNLFAIGPSSPELTFKTFQTYFAALVPKAPKAEKKTVSKKGKKKKTRTRRRRKTTRRRRKTTMKKTMKKRKKKRRRKTLNQFPPNHLLKKSIKLLKNNLIY